MTHPDPETARRAGRLRYAELVAAQEAALAADDMERFGELAGERTRIQGLLDALPRPTGDDDPEGAAALRRAYRAAHRVRERLDALRSEAEEALESLGRRRPQVRAYVRRDAGSPPERRLDVRL